MNPSITKILIGKGETEAALILRSFGKNWRIIFRDGVQVPNLSTDRDDHRYGLVINKGAVERVIYG